METYTVTCGYDKKSKYTVRPFTLEDIRAMATGNRSEYHIIDRAGMLRRCRRNGGLKTWKREPDRFEQGFKYGMYETFRLNTREMLESLVVIVED